MWRFAMLLTQLVGNYRTTIAAALKRSSVTHPNPTGRVTEIDPMMGCGRIGAEGGRDIYFHRNSLINADSTALMWIHGCNLSKRQAMRDHRQVRSRLSPDSIVISG
jgi:hypothetical protein